MLKHERVSFSLVNHEGGDVEIFDVQELGVLLGVEDGQFVEHLLTYPHNIQLAYDQPARYTARMDQENRKKFTGLATLSSVPQAAEEARHGSMLLLLWPRWRGKNTYYK